MHAKQIGLQMRLIEMPLVLQVICDRPKYWNSYINYNNLVISLNKINGLTNFILSGT